LQPHKPVSEGRFSIISAKAAVFAGVVGVFGVIVPIALYIFSQKAVEAKEVSAEDRRSIELIVESSTSCLSDVYNGKDKSCLDLYFDKASMKLIQDNVRDLTQRKHSVKCEMKGRSVINIIRNAEGQFGVDYTESWRYTIKNHIETKNERTSMVISNETGNMKIVSFISN
jgi:hypothetical protein